MKATLYYLHELFFLAVQRFDKELWVFSIQYVDAPLLVALAAWASVWAYWICMRQTKRYLKPLEILL